MESVGQILRNERLRQLLTLEEVSASTRITLKNLDAIEKDDLKQISSPFFYRSFVRQFADRLGLEFSTVSAAVETSANSLPRPLIPGEDGAPLPRVPALRRDRKLDFRWVSSVFSLILVLAGCSSVAALWHASQSTTGRASIVQLVRRFEISWPQAFTQSKPTHELRPAAPIPATSQQPARVLPDLPAPNHQARNEDSMVDSITGFRIEVSAIERTWISIVSDGKPVYSGILHADESKTLEGRESARIKMGNAGGVDVVFNGKEIGTLGPKGGVRTVVFTKDNYEIVEPSEHALLNGLELAGFKRIVE
jgi:hypothetical protein